MPTALVTLLKNISYLPDYEIINSYLSFIFLIGECWLKSHIFKVSKFLVSPSMCHFNFAIDLFTRLHILKVGSPANEATELLVPSYLFM